MTTFAKPDRRFCVAPMMDWTDRHCRAFHRVLTRHALLYTEMATSAAVTHGDVDRLIGFDAAEQPVALQLGGSDPGELAQASRIGADLGYCEINLNVGCPSDRVQSGKFGACLMREPELVADCLSAMQDAVSVPVTLKCRIGVDDQDPAAALPDLLELVRSRGIFTAIIHARKAWLKGLSPKENRSVPPLDYALVYQMKTAFRDMEIILNGGLETLQSGLEAQQNLDGIMLGRAAYHTPWEMSGVDPLIYGAERRFSAPDEAVLAYLPYIENQLAKGVRLHAMTRHMLGLFHGRPGARQWRRTLSENAVKDGAGLDVVMAALSATSPALATA
ncbi:tRNA dihydrouridine(20/20a) synthase DusA [Hyphobacterium sp. CCMP332]|uniref:tRNA dihydrouridine(20/20a) synthase DusA n=1 Tax=Hyphobacterium sp. CCMP332 TaxID=2749086 RepID=UPI001650050D|nr:tRNA dihydrouridine(20/20a) synthase DusA [Hyphobacterium sp. CCMP332]QNL19119.1 tRNA dihydrouridine(20/20a) synthase DusA [Hyphobacterium sp. CCMP332]